MNKLFAGLLVLGSISAYAQNYGGSTYYGYGSISMSDASYGSNRQPGGRGETEYFNFVAGSTRTFLKEEAKEICITGIASKGHSATNSVNDHRLNYDTKSCTSGDPIEVQVLVGSRFWVEKGQTLGSVLSPPYLTGEPPFDRNVEATRCLKISHLKRLIKKVNKKLKRIENRDSECPSGKLVLEGELVIF